MRIITKSLGGFPSDVAQVTRSAIKTAGGTLAFSLTKGFFSAFVLLWCLSGYLLHSHSLSVIGQRKMNSTDIVLLLSTPKKDYRVGENFKLAAYLENRSMQAFYVGNCLPGFNTVSPIHYIEVKMYNERNRLVPVGQSASDPIWGDKITNEEKIAICYLLLQPYSLHGKFESGKMQLKPGKYKLIASYNELEAVNWSAETINRLPAPIWTQKLVSNEVTIMVTR